MTPDETVRVLAERDGWEYEPEYQQWRKPVPAEPGWESWKHARVPVDINSRDSLAPVLAKLSEAEWDNLFDLLLWQNQVNDASPCWGQAEQAARIVLTLPPEKLAEAVASAIAKSKESAHTPAKETK